MKKKAAKSKCTKAEIEKALKAIKSKAKKQPTKGKTYTARKPSSVSGVRG
tara:strand:+ start:220 stop:369 length:150 start_codon:yes stop_codon:yes gene_type:complete